jgi:beta-barrel assembly-enhancing protease
MKAHRIAVLLLSLAAAAAACGRVGVDIGGSPELDRANKGLSKLGEFKDVRDAWREAVDLIRPEDERAIGQATAIALIARTNGLVDDQPLVDYVNQVGNLVALHGVRTKPSPKRPRAPSRRFYFGILDTSEATAYSLPGGHVFVTRGLLEQLTSESELAFVLAHEIAHIDLEHGLFALKAGKGVPAAAIEVLDLFRKKSEEGDWADRLWDDAKAFDGTVEAGADAALSWISVAQPGQERDADALGLQYVVKAGYDSRGAERVLEMLGSSDSPGDSKTHEPAKERLERLRKEIDRESGGVAGVDRWNTDAAPRLGTLMARVEESAR